MKKTALQTLIEKLDKRVGLFKQNYDDMTLSERGAYYAYLNIKNEATELLAKEREDIVEAFNGGGYFVIAISDSVLEVNEGAHEYFTETF